MDQPIPQLGKVVNVLEERPVCRDSQGNLLAGSPSVSLDLLLSNKRGEEMVLRVPVAAEVLAFYSAE